MQRMTSWTKVLAAQARPGRELSPLAPSGCRRVLSPVYAPDGAPTPASANASLPGPFRGFGAAFQSFIDRKSFGKLMFNSVAPANPVTPGDASRLHTSALGRPPLNCEKTSIMRCRRCRPRARHDLAAIRCPEWTGKRTCRQPAFHPPSTCGPGGSLPHREARP